MERTEDLFLQQQARLYIMGQTGPAPHPGGLSTHTAAEKQLWKKEEEHMLWDSVPMAASRPRTPLPVSLPQPSGRTHMQTNSAGMLR